MFFIPSKCLSPPLPHHAHLHLLAWTGKLRVFFKTKKSFAEKKPPDSHYMAQDQVEIILVIKIIWKLGLRNLKNFTINIQITTTESGKILKRP